MLRIALQMVNSKSKRNSNPLLPQDSSTPVNLQRQHRVAGHNNGLVIMQPHHKQASDGMVMTKDGNHKKKNIVLQCKAPQIRRHCLVLKPFSNVQYLP